MINFLFFKLGFMVLNYLDDFVGSEKPEKTGKVFSTLGNLLQSCGLE